MSNLVKPIESMIPDKMVTGLEEVRVLCTKVTTISNENERESALTLLKRAKTAVKWVEDQRKSFVNDAKIFMDNAMIRQKELQGILKPEIERLETMELSYLRAKAQEARRIQEEAQAKEVTNLAEAVAVDMEAQVAIQKIAPSKGVRKVKVLNIVDPDKIPRVFMIPNEDLIMATLKAGHEVPGCELVEEIQRSGR
jgi:CHAT domain-containing protein